MTTDAFPKTVAVEFDINGKSVRIGGIAKGAGMIAPNMLHATMLGFITTDIEISKEDLTDSLQKAADESFNNAVVDGDMSTNDTVYVLANAQSGVKYTDCKAEFVITSYSIHYTKLYDKAEFDGALAHVSKELAKMIVSDGEGAKKLIEATVYGAETKEDAKNRITSYNVCYTKLLRATQVLKTIPK